MSIFFAYFFYFQQKPAATCFSRVFAAACYCWHRIFSIFQAKNKQGESLLPKHI